MRSTLAFTRVLSAAVGILLLAVSATPTSGQQRLGTVTGKVTAAAGVPISSAKVTLINQVFERVVRAAVTGADGTFAMQRVPSGTYRLVISKQGVADTSVQDVRIEPGTVANLGEMSLAARPAQESSVRLPAVQTMSAVRGGQFSALEVESLPLGGTTEIRTFDEFVFLLPGVTSAPLTVGVRGPGVGFGSGQFSVNGQRARSNNFTIDGSDNNDPEVGLRRQGFVALVPQTIESVQQFQVSTLLYDAESGRNFGGQVNAVSKGGSNDYHGQAYGFFTDQRLNARNSYDYTGGTSGGEDPFTRGQWGGIFGGPIVKDKTQFLVAYEHQDVNAAVEQHFATIREDERRFLPVRTFGVIHFGPSFPFNTGFLTDSPVTPLGANVLSFYPLPNDPGGPYGQNTYTEVLPADGDGTVFSARISHQLSDNHQFEGRYNFLDDDRILPSFNQAIRSTLEATTRTQNLSLVLNSTLSSNVSNQARASYGRKTLTFPEYPTSPFLFSSSSVVQIRNDSGQVENYLSDTGPIGQLSIEPFSSVGIDPYLFPQGSSNEAYQAADTLSWTRGKHSLKFGFDVRRVRLNSFQDRLYRPLVTYGSGLRAFGLLTGGNPDGTMPFMFDPATPVAFLPGSQLASFGEPSSVLQVITRGAPDSTVRLRFTETDLFVHDSWRVRPGLTAEFGLRYEYNTVPTEADRRIEKTFALDDFPSATGSLVDNPVADFAFDQAVSAYRGILAGRTKIYDGDGNNFGPRVGFAWSPRQDGRTAVRGGYGIYFDAVLGALVSQSRNVFPNEVPVTITPSFVGADILNLPRLGILAIRDTHGNIARYLIRPGSLNQFGGEPEDFVPLIGRVFAQNVNAGGLASTLPDRDLATPYAQHWHLTLEHEIVSNVALSVAYVGTKGTKLTRLTTPNLGPNVTPFLPIATAQIDGTFVPSVVNDAYESVIRPRPNPYLGSLLIYENSAASNYHALQVEARRRYTGGFAFSFAYTWSHAIDDVSDVLPIAGASSLPQDSFDLRAERASASFDVRHRVAASGVWDLPYFRERTGVLARTLSDWQISSMFRMSGGQPFTLRLPVDLNLDGNLTDRPLTTEGLSFLTGHGPRRVAVDASAPLSNFVFYPFVGFASDGTLSIGGLNGGIGRNTVRADGFVDLDLAFSKSVRLSETQTLVVRTEVFNALNRANYGLPVRTLLSPGFGSSIDTVNPARLVQFVLKYSF